MRASRGFGEIRARSLGLIAVVFLTIVISSCGGNSTAIGVNITAVGSACQSNCTAASPAIVIKGQNETFAANVTGGSTTTVYWQICLPAPTPTSPPTQPTTCTPIPGVTLPGQKNQNLSGYGTITQTGLYTAPQTLPQHNPFVVMASSTVDYADFGVAYVLIDSGIRVLMVPPTTATIPTGANYTLTANVTGTTNTALTWAVNGTVGGSSQQNIGTIMPTGPNTAVYSAPTVALTADITATSVADSTQSGSATITVSTLANPTITSIDPSSAQQGSAQQDVYLTGSNFFSTSTVSVQGAPVPVTWISTSLMRATIPATQLAQAGTITIVATTPANNGPGDQSNTASLAVQPVRPSVLTAAVESIPVTTTGFGLNLVGGYFSSGTTTANFDSFSGGLISSSLTSSRQLSVSLPAGQLATPGLYPIVVQNSGVSSGSSTSAINIAVTPVPGTVTTSPTNTITVHQSNPSAIAIDQGDGLALVANTGSNSVSVINLTNFAVTNISVGNAPTGVAVDDMLAPDHLALVVNSADNTFSVIDLKTLAVTQTVSLAGLTPVTASSTSTPYSVAINPLTHRGFIADTSTNSGTVIDMLTANPNLSTPCGTPPCPVEQIGGPPSFYGTGAQPQISIDPRLNWAVVTAGATGIGVVNMVDLGRAPIAGIDPGRPATVVAAFTPSGVSGVAGVGVNPETHQVLLTIPSNGNFTTFSLLDQSVNTIAFTNQGVAEPQVGYGAAAVSSLPNVGVAVSANANNAAILDLENHLVIENVTVGNNPVAVAIDPATNQAFVANQADGTVSVLSLGPVRSSPGASQAPQITLSSPEITYTSTNPLTLTIDGGGFAPGAQVFLDGTALVGSVVSASLRQITATVPAAMLTGARRYSVYVQNSPGAPISNIEPLIVVQPIAVGNAPFGVAIDTDCDVAAVTNSGDATVSIIALTPLPPAPLPPSRICASNGTVGVVGPAVSVGATPEGIDVEPRLGIAVVANTTGPSTASVVDLTELNPPSTVTLCGGACTNLGGVAFNHDNATAEITSVTSSSFGNVGSVNGVTVSRDASNVPSGTSGQGATGLDLTPTDVAVDPYLQYLGITTAGQNSAIDIFNLQQGTKTTVSSLTGLGVQVPTGIIFDPVNQFFVVANSLVNNVLFVDPSTLLSSSAQVGMNPSSLDYNYQTSTLVTVNNASNTMSILAYVCPPTVLTTTCSAPTVREILPFGPASQASASGAPPQFSVRIDPKLNLAVLADRDNNRVLLIPLP